MKDTAQSYSLSFILRILRHITVQNRDRMRRHHCSQNDVHCHLSQFFYQATNVERDAAFSTKITQYVHTGLQHKTINLISFINF